MPCWTTELWHTTQDAAPSHRSRSATAWTIPGLPMPGLQCSADCSPGQSILEGLNALLDHRAEVYIPELAQKFACPPSFRIFAAQNPVQEGGGRRGLPKSFLNRFTRVHVELLRSHDLQFIAGEAAEKPHMPEVCPQLTHVPAPGVLALAGPQIHSL